MTFLSLKCPILITLSAKLRLTELIFDNFSGQRHTKGNKFSLFFAQFHVKIADDDEKLALNKFVFCDK